MFGAALTQIADTNKNKRLKTWKKVDEAEAARVKEADHEKDKNFIECVLQACARTHIRLALRVTRNGSVECGRRCVGLLVASRGSLPVHTPCPCSYTCHAHPAVVSSSSLTKD